MSSKLRDSSAWSRCTHTVLNNNTTMNNNKIITKALNKVVKNLSDTQLFIANESNRVDQELAQLTGIMNGLGERLSEVEDSRTPQTG